VNIQESAKALEAAKQAPGAANPPYWQED